MTAAHQTPIMGAMDASLAAAAEALSQGDPLRALKHVALRHDPEGLALRATALAQLGEYRDAKALLTRAAKGFDQHHAMARARCAVALAEVALATRELHTGEAGLARAIAVLSRHGDVANARYAQLLHARFALTLGDVARAEQRLRTLDASDAAPLLRTLVQLAHAEVALRTMQPTRAQRALTLAAQSALRSQIPALIAEVQSAKEVLARPVAKLSNDHGVTLLSFAQVAKLYASDALIVDGCRRCVQQGALRVSYGTRPVLFSLIRRLAEASPREVSRSDLIRAGFGMQRSNDSLRARLRVAMGRVRKQLSSVATVRASAGGFELVPLAGSLHVLLPPLDEPASNLLALLSDGEAWSTAALALALGESQRSVQRALNTLQGAGKVTTLGRGKGRRWLAPPLHLFATHLLLPSPSRAP